MYQPDDLIIIRSANPKQPFHGDVVRVVVPPPSIAVGEAMTIEHRGTQYRVTLIADKGGNVKGWEIQNVAGDGKELR